jgi:GNAT-family acetyltransferase (TIGR03103 family)
VSVDPGGYERLNRHSRVIVDEARSRGVSVEIVDPVAGELRLRFGGRAITTLESLSELTTAVAFRRCDDKLLTRRVLHEAELPVAPGRAATFDQADDDFLHQHGDLVVKPVRGEQGRGITVGVTTADGLDRARGLARRFWPEVLLEKRCEGEDLRVVVIDGAVIAAAVRRPPTVTGTGSQTLGELIGRYSQERATVTGADSAIPLDDVTHDTLRAAGFDDLDRVVPDGMAVMVRRTANVHTGGTIEDVTDALHRQIQELAVAAAAAVGLPVAGIDLIVDSITAPGGIIIEVNEQPGLANHEPRPTAARFLDLLFPETASGGSAGDP